MVRVLASMFAACFPALTTMSSKAGACVGGVVCKRNACFFLRLAKDLVTSKGPGAMFLKGVLKDMNLPWPDGSDMEYWACERRQAAARLLRHDFREPGRRAPPRF